MMATMTLPDPVDAARPTAPPRRTHDSMELLRSLVDESLDEGYARAAAHRQDGAGRSRRGVVWTTLGLVSVGLLLSTAFGQTRLSAGSAASERDSLVREVESRNSANEQLQSRLVDLRAEVVGAQRRALELTGAGAALSTRLRTLESASGAGPVVGPGMTVRLADAPVDPAAGGSDVDPRTDASTSGRVTDRDLQTVVNEIWAAGAEAVAVNGQRLTALSAIRSAGDAVLVDFRPLTPPYLLDVIGDPATLRDRFVGGFGGSYLQVLRGYGIDSSVDAKTKVNLPASAGVALRYAEPGARRSTTDEGSSAP